MLKHEGMSAQQLVGSVIRVQKDVPKDRRRDSSSSRQGERSQVGNQGHKCYTLFGVAETEERGGIWMPWSLKIHKNKGSSWAEVDGTKTQNLRSQLVSDNIAKIKEQE